MVSRWGLLICQVCLLGMGGSAAIGALSGLLWSQTKISPDEALRNAPANAYLWVDLAWAEHRQGDEVAALLALSHSWDLAPYSQNLSLQRAQLGARFWTKLTPRDRRHLLRDMIEARNRARTIFTELTNRSPRFATLWRTARRYSHIQKGSRL